MVDLNESFIMTKDNFKDFLKIINYFSDECNDLDIVDRQVFQRTNDRVVAIKCDLSNLIKFDGELIFCDIKKLVKNLKELNKDGPIRFKRVGNTMRIKDTVTSIDIPVGNEVFIDNKNITDTELNTIFNPGPVLLESELDGNLCESIKKYAKITNSHKVTLSIKSKKAVLRYGKVDSKSTSAEFKFNYKLIDDMPDCEMYLSTIPFNLKSATTLKMYFAGNSIDTNIAFGVFKIPFNPNITFEIYTRSAIIKEQEED